MELHPSERAFYSEIAAHKNWHAAAEEAMKHLASSGHAFSADDVRELLSDAGEPATPNSYGGLFMSWSRAGLIERVGGGSSRGSKRNGGYRHLWRGRTQSIAA